MKMIIEKSNEHQPNYKITLVPEGIHEERVEFFIAGEKTDHVYTPNLTIEVKQ